MLRPVRCRRCRQRFYRMWFLANRAQPAVPYHTPVEVSVPADSVRFVAAPAEPDIPDPMPPSILLLDDDSAVRRLFRRLLEKEGYEVREAGTLRQASAEIRDRNADLMIVNLGPREGRSDVTALCDADPQMRLIVLAQSEDLREIEGRLIVMPQPAKPAAVVECAKHLLAEREVREAVRA